MNMLSFKNSWETFKQEFQEAILPIYQNHEKRFDYFGFHGRRHISRVLLFAEAIARYYHLQLNQEIDFYALRVAISLHDSAREGNGKDLWEQQSAKNCFDYLIAKGYDQQKALKISNSILIKDKNALSSHFDKTIYNADVIDIMRLFVDSPEGWKRFRTEELTFLNNQPSQQQFILEAWKLIYTTEKNTSKIDNKQLLHTYLKIIEEDKVHFPFLYSMLIA